MKVKKWMGRLRKAAMECNYKELDRQLKDQFIHGLNDSELLTEIIRELTKSHENTMVPSEHVLILAKRIEGQRAQAAVINSLHEVKNLDAMWQKDDGKQRNKTGHTCLNGHKKKIQILQLGAQSEGMPSIWQEYKLQ